MNDRDQLRADLAALSDEALINAAVAAKLLARQYRSDRVLADRLELIWQEWCGRCPSAAAERWQTLVLAEVVRQERTR